MNKQNIKYNIFENKIGNLLFSSSTSKCMVILFLTPFHLRLADNLPVTPDVTLKQHTSLILLKCYDCNISKVCAYRVYVNPVPHTTYPSKRTRVCFKNKLTITVLWKGTLYPKCYSA
jgi:hypothetical protein